MTTIAYRNGVMAADSFVIGDGVVYGNSRKITKNKNGDICGGSGTLCILERFQKWFQDGEIGDCPKLIGEDDASAQIIVVRVDGRIQEFSKNGVFTYEDTPYVVVGSGGDIALGAMHAGANAYDAVRAAIHHDTRTGGTIRTLRLGRD